MPEIPSESFRRMPLGRSLFSMPRLTEQEQQEIIRYIEADKPLPEKVSLSGV
jgi:hypothetical protein